MLSLRSTLNPQRSSLMPLDLLQQLISIPSQNPMGRDVSGPEFLEGGMSDFLEGYFRQLGVKYERREIAPGRANVVACYESPGAKRTVMLDAHEDTVPVDGMTIPPYTPTISDGKTTEITTTTHAIAVGVTSGSTRYSA